MIDIWIVSKLIFKASIDILVTQFFVTKTLFYTRNEEWKLKHKDNRSFPKNDSSFPIGWMYYKSKKLNK